jgi:hypothetical protein
LLIFKEAGTFSFAFQMIQSFSMTEVNLFDMIREEQRGFRICGGTAISASKAKTKTIGESMISVGGRDFHNRKSQ